MSILGKLNLFFIILFLLSVLFFGCLKGENVSSSKASEPALETSSAHVFSYSDTSSFSKYKIPSLNSEIDDEPLLLSFTTEAHKKYLNDALIFTDLPDGGFPNGHTAVVGSDECVFYLVETIYSDDDLGKLPQGEIIPFASIILLGEKIINSNYYYDNMFNFQDKLNYFYKTIWNGKHGIVFGADLYGIDESNENNRINALLYKNNGHFENFYRVTGYDKITPDIINELERNGIAFQEIKTNDHDLLSENSDSLLSLYKKLTDKKTTPVFITTDLAVYINHLVFSRVFQYVEEEYLYDRIVLLTNELINAITEKKDQVPEEAYARSILFFQTAQVLLALAPKKAAERFYNTIEYQNVDVEYVLSGYPLQVREEVNKIYNADEVLNSSIFLQMQENYSLYEAGGHYEKNGILAAFFRVLIWYSRIINDSKSSNFLPVMNLVADIVKNSPELDNLWQSVFNTINGLYGISGGIKIKSLRQFEEGSGFYFTEKPEWSKKAFNSAIVTSNAHNHIAIINISNNDYIETEREEETLKPVFRTKPLPYPVLYIEPNVPFWIASANEIKEIYQLLKNYNYLDEELGKVLTDIFDFFCKAAEISMLEADDMPISSNDLAWIERIAEKFINFKAEYSPDVLNNIYRIYIPLNDRQGGKRIAVGYGFNNKEL